MHTFDRKSLKIQRYAAFLHVTLFRVFYVDLDKTRKYKRQFFCHPVYPSRINRTKNFVEELFKIKRRYFFEKSAFPSGKMRYRQTSLQDVHVRYSNFPSEFFQNL